jgi:SAM-dependent methyltransferase
VRRILDLGCGTGGHAVILAQRGYAVTGVDRSNEMLEAAREKTSCKPELANIPSFRQGDIRDFDLGTRFDAVIAMFAVVSYMITNTDIMAAFRAVYRHLNPGGLFVFDAWSGLAVLTERPVERCKIIEANGERIVRIAQPEVNLLQHTVTVHYKILRLEGKHLKAEADEIHPIRFVFPQEVAHYLEDTGFQMRRLCPFLRLKEEVTERDWNIAVVAEAGRTMIR